MTKIVPISGNDQQAVVLQTPTAAELNAVAEIPESEGSSRSVGKVIPADKAVIDYPVKMSKRMRLRHTHQGFKELAIPMNSEPKWEKQEVTLDDGSKIEAYAYKAPEDRDINKPYAQTHDDHVLEEPGTFSKVSGYQYEEGDKKLGYFESIRYDQNAISIEGSGNGLIQPVPALAADEELAQQVDRHWRNGQDLFTPIDAENYLSRPGMKVVTSETYLAQENK